MTTLINDTQKQAVDSPYVELFEIEISDGNYIYFHSENTAGDLQFRNRYNPSVINTYQNIPAKFTGFEQKVEGASNRPRIQISNVLSTFDDLIGGDEDSLTGKRFTRRTTLYKYLYGQPSDSSPPREFPVQTYVIERFDSKNNIATTFELSNPFDLAGVKIPRRQVIQNTCDWPYQQAGKDLSESVKRGACVWRTNSKIYIGDNEYQPFFDKFDNPIIPPGPYPAYSGGTTTKNSVRYSSVVVNRYNLDGTTNPEDINEYWQARKTGVLYTPEENSNWRRIRIYLTWIPGYTYYARKEEYFSDIVLYDDKLWKTKFTTNSINPPTYGPYWERVDLCSKRLEGCAVRFNFLPSTSTVPSIDRANRRLPYGGFSSSRAF
tara:strand:+ start:652 stop:1782 length:1131 start_codon:yes stop_codon:yes gene_type:complete